MRPKGSVAELEARRLWAGRLLSEGNDVSEVAEMVEASIASGERWLRADKEGGLVDSEAEPHPGRMPRLNGSHKERLLINLVAGAILAGYTTDLWTCRPVAEVVAREFGGAIIRTMSGDFCINSVGFARSRNIVSANAMPRPSTAVGKKTGRTS